MKRFLLAIQFLTIIPIKVNGAVSEKDMSRSVAFFPVVGAFQGLLAVFSASLLLKFFSPDIASGLVILILIISNGGFHLDGLADTFDALAVKSSGDKTTDKEKRLNVMKDSSTGPVGVIAIVISILLKFLLLNNILHNYLLSTIYYPLFLMPVLSKWAMNSAIFHGRSARKDGLGKMFIDGSGVKGFLSAMVLTVGCSLLTLGIIRSPLLLFVPLFVSYILGFSAARFSDKKFGGLTGDTLGAISEITEVTFLLTVIAWSRISI
ncbi:MAG: adenosylcobinamide-GDP ribazoletransferase [Nitrospirae bacterium]|nr:adenosylcobinamide-GDP ribazoletransferase [Nitrospirota bacterium]